MNLEMHSSLQLHVLANYHTNFQWEVVLQKKSCLLVHSYLALEHGVRGHELLSEKIVT